ncbi:hypothetical protein IMG5_000850 [Ichthyophthirius multifiliis]|uniref:Transmembrane protein n=1 Tax=Ichthyophthirius multifiliis TaxID=5932 RepID=G0QIX2_ICHMU|nr:hypothetical protein IMG5_000850 [Ichthyophthirius multifiliis]EGR34857.1 hypothetical protein IMG5_000850 [Ichthyophthirius multifiliis]|eukprot:XP_004040161.1 hypothetical protein IMG5_000850 [Ichthyophthirius multifiliis]
MNKITIKFAFLIVWEMQYFWIFKSLILQETFKNKKEEQMIYLGKMKMYQLLLEKIKQFITQIQELKIVFAKNLKMVIFKKHIIQVGTKKKTNYFQLETIIILFYGINIILKNIYTNYKIIIQQLRQLLGVTLKRTILFQVVEIQMENQNYGIAFLEKNYFLLIQITKFIIFIILQKTLSGILLLVKVIIKQQFGRKMLIINFQKYKNQKHTNKQLIKVV